ncbi:MAG: DUF2887 domain-containing protein [Waterburya sp.]
MLISYRYIDWSQPRLESEWNVLLQLAVKIGRTRQELTDTTSQKQLLELIETIVIHKFPQLSYQEIENMLNLEEIKQTKVYQDAKSEGKLEQKIAMIPILQELGLNIEQIAQRLEIEENLVRENLK